MDHFEFAALRSNRSFFVRFRFDTAHEYVTLRAGNTKTKQKYVHTSCKLTSIRNNASLEYFFIRIAIVSFERKKMHNT